MKNQFGVKRMLKFKTKIIHLFIKSTNMFNFPHSFGADNHFPMCFHCTILFTAYCNDVIKNLHTSCNYSQIFSQNRFCCFFYAGGLYGVIQSAFLGSKRIGGDRVVWQRQLLPGVVPELRPPLKGASPLVPHHWSFTTNTSSSCQILECNRSVKTETRRKNCKKIEYQV